MVLEYKSAGRITGNSTDNLVTPTFEDFFTTDTNWTLSSGSDHSINTTLQRLEYSSIRDTTEDNIIHDLTSASDTAWTLRFCINFDEVTTPASGNIDMYVGLFSTNETSGLDATQDGIAVRLGLVTSDTRIHGIAVDGASLNTTEDIVLQQKIISGERLYIELKRLSATTFSIGIYNDQSFSELLEHQVGECASTTQSLRYLGIKSNDLSTLAGELNGFIDNVQFWDGVETVPTADFTEEYTTNSGWTQQGTLVTVDSGVADKVDGNAVVGGVDHRVWKDIGSAISDTDFVVEIDYTLEAEANSPNHHVFILSDASTDPVVSTATQDSISIRQGNNTSNQLFLTYSNAGNLDTPTGASSAFTTSISTTYYLRITRVGDNLTLYIFSDSGRTNLSATLTLAVTAVTGLRYIHHAGNTSAGATRSVTYQCDNLNIWDGINTFDAPVDNDSKPYEVPTWSTLDELDTSTRKTYMGNKNYVPLGTRFDSYYQHRSPFSVLQKQHFWEFFSGKQLSSIWTQTTITAGTLTFDIFDGIDRGARLLDASTTGHLQLDFNNKRQYNFDGAVMVVLFRHGAGSLQRTYAGLHGDQLASPADMIQHEKDWANTFQRLGTNDGGVATYTNTSLSNVEVMEATKLEVTPSNTLLTVDGTLEVSKTTDLPTAKLQPVFGLENNGSTNRGAYCQYLEVYNT